MTSYSDFVTNPLLLHTTKRSIYGTNPAPVIGHFPVDTNIRQLIINDALISDELANAVTDGEILETADYAAGTLTINIVDRSRKLIHGLLKQWVSASTPVVYTSIAGQRRHKVVPKEWNEIFCTFDGRDYALVQCHKNGDMFTLTLENRSIHEMRRYSQPKIWHRDLHTRAEVVFDMCKEVRPYHVQFYAPELDLVQPVKTLKGLPQPKEVLSHKKKGFGKNAKITIKGHTATSQQKSRIGTVLRCGDHKKASYTAQTSALITCIELSNFNLTQPHNATQFGGGSGLFGFVNSSDEVSDSNSFYDHAKKLEKEFPGMSADLMALNIVARRPDAPFNVQEFTRWIPEAEKILEQWGTSLVGGSVKFTEYNRYVFKRGLDGKRENSWDCAVRLAREVNWRVFSTDNILWWVSDNDLRNSIPWDTVSEETDGIDTIDYEIDSGKPLNEVTIIAHLSRWQCPPGVPIVIEDSGPADGRWLVYEVRRPMKSDVGEITCHLPSPPLPEPAPTTQVRTVKTTARGGSHRTSEVGGALLSKASSSVPGHPELKPGISKIVNIVLRQFPGLVITSTTRGGHASGSYHYLGRAADIAGTTSLMNQAAGWIKSNIAAQLTEGIHNPNLSVKYGKEVGPSYWGSTTWGEHTNHIHLAV
jgi:hypothetical protein